MHYQLRNDDGSQSIWQPQKVVCVAKNYADHAAEMRSAVPAQPTFFIKPNTSLCELTAPLNLPRDRGAVHHEIELGLVIGKRLSRADRVPADALAGYVLAIDLTLRELQTRLREQGHPWEASKGFAGACPVSPLLGVDAVPDAAAAELGIAVNGETRQAGNTRDMVFKIPRLLAEAAEIFVLEPGDILLTGTPVGVGPLEPGDRFEAWLNERRFAGEVPPVSGLSIAVLCISDSRDLAGDRSGAYVAQALQDAGHRLAERGVTPDDRYAIRARLSHWIADPALDAIITTGGTGITGRDVTPEAVAPLLDRHLDGFGELFRTLSYEEIGAATIQSRALAGVANATLVFCLPGSTGAVRLAWEQILRPQLDSATRPCNFAMLVPRLSER